MFAKKVSVENDISDKVPTSYSIWVAAHIVVV